MPFARVPHNKTGNWSVSCATSKSNRYVQVGSGLGRESKVSVAAVRCRVWARHRRIAEAGDARAPLRLSGHERHRRLRLADHCSRANRQRSHTRGNRAPQAIVSDTDRRSSCGATGRGPRHVPCRANVRQVSRRATRVSGAASAQHTCRGGSAVGSGTGAAPCPNCRRAVPGRADSRTVQLRRGRGRCIGAGVGPGHQRRRPNTADRQRQVHVVVVLVAVEVARPATVGRHRGVGHIDDQQGALRGWRRALPGAWQRPVPDSAMGPARVRYAGRPHAMPGS